MARYADAERRYEQLGRITDLEARFLLGSFMAGAPDAFLRAADNLDRRRAQTAAEQEPPVTHIGADPAHGGLTKHKGPQENCPGPDCAPEIPTGHVDVVCTDPECNGCQFCAGGLWACTVCDGLEGSMPSQCPGERMSDETIDAVYAGRKDFRDGHWIDAPSRFCPAGYAAAATEEDA